MAMTRDNVIEAAGGILCRMEGDKQLIALVHRTRYGGEWTLPKGKRNEDESWIEAAKREISEETGCEDVSVGELAGILHYPVDGGIKIVLFWNMEPTGKCEFKKSQEVDDVKWLPPAEAVKMLRYEKERSLIQDTFKITSTQAKLPQRKCIKSLNHKRLDAAIGPFKLEIDSLIAEKLVKKEDLYPIAEYVNEMLRKAELASAANEVELGWRYLLEAELLSLYLRDREYLMATAKITLDEAEEKLDAWRKNAVRHLLGDENAAPYTGEDVDKLIVARRVLQEHHNNTWVKTNTAQFQLKILSAAGFLVLIVSVWFLSMIMKDSRYFQWEFLITVALIGACGGVISGIFSVARGSSKKKIPNQILDSWVTLLRPLVGAISALAVLLFLVSGMVHFGELSEHLIFAIAFTSGFSERIIVSAVETSEKGKS